jgi:GntR family transcriptional regulator, transcriptional repressor for pyruvate dehydrogenase complex
VPGRQTRSSDQDPVARPSQGPKGEIGASEAAGQGTSRAHAIAEKVRRHILSGKYAPGECLPSERELAKHLGGARGSAREALKRLEQEGLISIRHGGRARVVPLEKAGLNVLQHVLENGDRPNPEIVSQWLDVHELVIAGGARLAVERASREERMQAKYLLTQLVHVRASDDELIACIDDLTELIGIASRNVVLRLVRNGLVAQRRLDVNKALLNRPSRRALLQLARTLRCAIDERDGAAAEASVREFLATQRQAIIERISHS